MLSGKSNAEFEVKSAFYNAINIFAA